MNKNIIKIRIVLWFILAVITAWFGYLKIVPSGNISYVYDFKKASSFIGKLAPAERVDVNGGQAEIKGEPVYFSVRPPRRFEKARVTLAFKNTADFSVMELGLLNDKVSFNYDLKPMENKIIDQLAMVWPSVIGQNGAKLYQREKKYDSLEKFLEALPEIASGEIALYNYDLNKKFLLDDYAPARGKNIIDNKLRGSYQFYTYVKNQSLDYAFEFSDLNLNQDSDPVEIKVFSPDGMIYSSIRVSDEQADSRSRRADIRLPNLPEGVYRVSVAANDDIITESIATELHIFSLINKVWLAESNKNGQTLFTNSRVVNAQTLNPASLGSVNVGGTILNLAETYRQFSVKINSAKTEIKLPANDIIISGDGVFSFSPSGLINPGFKNINSNLDVNGEKINYVLADYDTPGYAAGLQTASAEFDLTRGYSEDGKYQFLISLPGLKVEEENDGSVILKEIKVEFFGTSLSQKIKKYYESLF